MASVPINRAGVTVTIMPGLLVGIACHTVLWRGKPWQQGITPTAGCEVSCLSIPNIEGGWV